MPVTVKQWLDLVKLRPVAFGLEAGFDDLRDLHNDWIKLFVCSTEDVTLQAHRGSYKTTCLAIALALMIVIYPTKTMIFTRKTDDDVKEIVAMIAKLLRTDMYQALSMALWNKPIEFERLSVFEIDTNLKASPRGSAQLLGMGSKGSVTGKHADIVVTDDIINLQDRISPAERQRTKLYYQELQNIKNRGGRMINTGTPWHKDDAFELMPNLTKYTCYDTGMIAHEELQRLRNSMSVSLFAANYELEHIADEDQLFRAPTIDDGSRTHLIYDGIGHIDASYGGSDGTAFTIARRHDDGRIYVYGELRQMHVDDCLKAFEGRRKLYRAGTIYLERNADKGYLASKIDQPVKTYHENTNKYIKISSYLRSEWNNIVFLKSTDTNYIAQILDYTEFASHDDAPDSLASAIRILSKPKIQLKTFSGGI